MITISKSGNSKLAKIQKAAELARLGLQLATKPFEAYAETASAYPAPLGPALGVAHAAAVAAQIGSAMSAVGGSGGSSGASGGAVSAPDDFDAYDDDSFESDETKDKKRVINIVVNLEADGKAIAKLVEQEIAFAEDD